MTGNVSSDVSSLIKDDLKFPLETLEPATVRGSNRESSESSYETETTSYLPSSTCTRRYTALLVVCVLLCVTSGLSSVLSVKWMALQSVKSCYNCDPTPFQAPFLQTLAMFLAEFACLGVHWIDSTVASKHHRQSLLTFVVEDGEAAATKCNAWWWVSPSFLDFLGTTLCNYAFIHTHANSVQFIRNWIVVVIVLTQFLVIKRPLKGYEWAGAILISLSVVLASLQVALDPARASNIGVVYALLGTCLTATQVVWEEFLYMKGYISPVQAVGIEGTAGVYFVIALLPVVHEGHLSNVLGNFYQIYHSSNLQAAFAVQIVSCFTFNLSGIFVTRLAQPGLRSLIFASRAPLVAAAEAALKWPMPQPVFLASTIIVFLIGFAMHSNLWPFSRMRSLQEPIGCCGHNYIYEDEDDQPGSSDIRALDIADPSEFEDDEADHGKEAEKKTTSESKSQSTIAEDPPPFVPKPANETINDIAIMVSALRPPVASRPLLVNQISEERTAPELELHVLPSRESSNSRAFLRERGSLNSNSRAMLRDRVSMGSNRCASLTRDCLPPRLQLPSPRRASRQYLIVEPVAVRNRSASPPADGIKATPRQRAWTIDSDQAQRPPAASPREKIHKRPKHEYATMADDPRRRGTRRSRAVSVNGPSDRRPRILSVNSQSSKSHSGHVSRQIAVSSDSPHSGSIQKSRERSHSVSSRRLSRPYIETSRPRGVPSVRHKPRTISGRGAMLPSPPSASSSEREYGELWSEKQRRRASVNKPAPTTVMGKSTMRSREEDRTTKRIKSTRTRRYNNPESSQYVALADVQERKMSRYQGDLEEEYITYRPGARRASKEIRSIRAPSRSARTRSRRMSQPLP